MDWLDWLLLVIRVVVVFFVLLIAVMLYIWMERKVIADMQTRMGPMRAGPRGILITLADGIKLFFKEGITPTNADRGVYQLAPVLAMFPGFLAFATIPFGTGVTLFGRAVPFQLTDLNIGILWILAMTSIGVYGVVLAGWSSGSNYPLLGSVRSSAQMISYEVGMGLAIVAVVMFSGHIRLSEIVAQQDGSFPRWNIVPMFPAFVIFFIGALAETNRPPFDLAEAETELVAGLPHRVLRHQVRHVLPGRIREHGHGLRRDGDAVPGRLARPVVPRAHAVGGPAAVVPLQGHRGHLRDDPGARDPAPHAL